MMTPTQRSFALLLSLFLLPALSVSAQVDANRILENIRFGATLQETDLKGQIRKGGEKTPVHLFMRGENIQFHLSEKKQLNRFHVRLGQNDIDLFEIGDSGKTKKFPAARLGQPIANSDLTYEDLSLRFLYWNTGKIVGEEKVGIHDCYKIRLVNPTKKGKYRIVYVWAHKKYHALIQVLGYNAAGEPLKSFKITSIMKVGKFHTIKQMRIDTMDPKTNRSKGVTYLEFRKPKKIGLRGGGPR